jgi:hypothetical protein
MIQDLLRQELLLQNLFFFALSYQVVLGLSRKGLSFQYHKHLQYKKSTQTNQ